MSTKLFESKAFGSITVELMFVKTIHPGHLQQMAELCIRVNKFESNKLDGELYYMDFYTRGEKEFERRIVDFQYQLELNGIVASFLHDRKMPAM